MICSTLSGKLSIKHPRLGYLVRQDGFVFHRTVNQYSPYEYTAGSKDINGYMHITHTLVHILVAECFVPNPNGYDTVDHIDRVRDNNVYTNLRWCDRIEQQRNSSRFNPEYSQVKRLKKREYMRKFRAGWRAKQV